MIQQISVKVIEIPAYGRRVSIRDRVISTASIVFIAQLLSIKERSLVFIIGHTFIQKGVYARNHWNLVFYNGMFGSKSNASRRAKNVPARRENKINRILKKKIRVFPAAWTRCSHAVKSENKSQSRERKLPPRRINCGIVRKEREKKQEQIHVPSQQNANSKTKENGTSMRLPKDRFNYLTTF